MTLVDDIFDDPRLAAMYDPLDPDRSDLDVYVAIADELSARRVLDVGCGTGTFALMLADKGLEVTGVDPAKASLDVARAKPGAERVRWIHGDATALPRARGRSGDDDGQRGSGDRRRGRVELNAARRPRHSASGWTSRVRDARPRIRGVARVDATTRPTRSRRSAASAPSRTGPTSRRWNSRSSPFAGPSSSPTASVVDVRLDAAFSRA